MEHQDTAASSGTPAGIAPDTSDSLDAPVFAPGDGHFSAEFTVLEQTLASSFFTAGKFPALYQLLYFRYQDLLTRERHYADTTASPAFWILLAQALASGELRGERGEDWQITASNLEGRLCFSLDDLAELYDAAIRSVEYRGKNKAKAAKAAGSGLLFARNLRSLCERSREEQNAALLPGFCQPDFAALRPRQGDNQENQDGSMSSMSSMSRGKAAPGNAEEYAEYGEYFWYWQTPEEPEQQGQWYFCLGRLGRLQVALYQSLSTRLAPLPGEVVQQDLHSRATHDADPQPATQPCILEQPRWIFSALETLAPDLLQSSDLIRACLEKLCRQHLLLISGGPGSGKTSLLAGLLRVLQEAQRKAGPTLRKLELTLCAPTARAAQRMLESLNYASAEGSEPPESHTLHKLLGLGWANARLYRPGGHSGGCGLLRLLSLDILVLDEVSMLDSELAHRLLQQLSPGTRLILIGDPNQLPPVGPGAFWKDLLAGIAPQHKHAGGGDCLIRLQGSHRSVREIRQLGELVLQGRPREFYAALEAGQTDDGRTEAALSWLARPPVPASGQDMSGGFAAWADYLRRHWCPREPGQQNPHFAALELQRGPTLAQSLEQITHYFQWMRDYGILSPLLRGGNAARAINQILLQQGATRGPACPQQRFFSGCPIQITRNNYQLNLYNGDRGFCFRFGWQDYGVFPAGFVSGGENTAAGSVMLGDYRLVPLMRLADCEAAFVQTIHKSQGSEYRRVCVLLPEPGTSARGRADLPLYSGYNPWSRALLYTAVTRAREHLCFSGSRAAVGLATQALEQQAEPVSLLSQLLQS